MTSLAHVTQSGEGLDLGTGDSIATGVGRLLGSVMLWSPFLSESTPLLSCPA